MNRKIPFSACLVLMLITAVLTFQIVTVWDEANYNKDLDMFTVHPLDHPKISEIGSLVGQYYVKDIDEELLTTSMAYGYVLGLGDPHAGYYTPEAYREYTSSLQGALTGIGIRVTLEMLDDGTTDRVVIFEVMKNSPAEKAGILPGDILYSVEGTLYSELGYDKAVDLMLGEEGSVLHFEVLRGDKIQSFEITRRNFESQLVSYKVTETDPDIGYIRIYQFSSAAVGQFISAVEDLHSQGVKSLIFDVRNNPGGEYKTIVQILDYLLPEGKIIITENKLGEGKTEWSDASEIDMPMVVLANESTASAAELFTAALLDYNKAVFIGTTTYGKGTVQTTFPLSDGSAVKFSTEYYLPPSGVSYDGIGIVPTEEVLLSEEALSRFYLISEGEDAQLMAAIEHLNTESQE